jgi:hypothetical protein
MVLVEPQQLQAVQADLAGVQEHLVQTVLRVPQLLQQALQVILKPQELQVQTVQVAPQQQLVLQVHLQQLVLQVYLNLQVQMVQMVLLVLLQQQVHQVYPNLRVQVVQMVLLEHLLLLQVQAGLQELQVLQDQMVQAVRLRLQLVQVV